ncbi:hypothetical protein SG34_015600 [Thalassomonas viridans]|uniref:Uncharacterized protein n=1 Tax=Thalassomonas viridans TaxID=137584 RepID=A0AAE9YYU6_9GAMM|nr:hypothetical protein [Thalassomonas viridans]WDE02869.1 hypothetical protein SG34_015600 [Thalassomonas viridans]
MNIDSTNPSLVTSTNSYMDYQKATQEQIEKFQATMQEKTQAKTLDVSDKGKIHSYMSSLSPEERTEAKTFLDSVKSAKEDGSFDAATFAGQAPESIKNMAGEFGVNLEDMLGKAPKENPLMNAQGTFKGGANLYRQVSAFNTGQEQTTSIMDILADEQA